MRLIAFFRLSCLSLVTAPALAVTTTCPAGSSPTSEWIKTFPGLKSDKPCITYHEVFSDADAKSKMQSLYQGNPSVTFVMIGMIAMKQRERLGRQLTADEVREYSWGIPGVDKRLAKTLVDDNTITNEVAAEILGDSGAVPNKEPDVAPPTKEPDAAPPAKEPDGSSQENAEPTDSEQ